MLLLLLTSDYLPQFWTQLVNVRKDIQMSLGQHNDAAI